MARGKALTEVEKFAIQAMLEQEMSVSRIAVKVGRAESTVTKFIKEELANLSSFIEDDQGFLPPAVEKLLLKRLLDGGLSKMDAVGTVNRVKGKLQSAVTLEQIDGLYHVALRHTSPKDLIVTEGQGGQKGVAIMTAGGSGRGDAIRETRRPRDLSGHIFRQEDAIE